MNRTSSNQPAAVRGCVDVCGRCDRLVEAVELAPAPTGRQVYQLIGPHLRHCLDHFTALFRGLATGDVDYDARDRDQAIERQPERFRSALAGAVEHLGSIDASGLQRPLRIVQLAAAGAERAPVGTTLERELIFLSSHTIHHLALMVHLAASNGVEVSEDIGVAFSTSAHRDSLRAAKSQ